MPLTRPVPAAAATLALGLLATGVAAQPARYEVDPTHTFVMYEMGHYATTTNRGRFSTKSGTVTLDRAARSGKVDITIDISSINTGVDLLNRHVQSSDFFDVAKYPNGRFVSDRVDFNGDRISAVHGMLTLMGQAQPVSLQALRFNCYESPLFKREVCGGDFETVVQRSQWGLTWGLAFGFEDKVRLLVQVEGVRLDAARP